MRELKQKTQKKETYAEKTKKYENQKQFILNIFKKSKPQKIFKKIKKTNMSRNKCNKLF